MRKLPPYWNRPAKSIQRYMLVDALRLLRTVAKLTDYRYVGFGSWEFVDFQLMRRHLGIRDMISIEKDNHRAERYEFNKPFAEVELQFGQSNEVLGDLDWSDLNIVWLDYTSSITHLILEDAAFLAEELVPGSVLCISLQVNPPPEDRLELLAGQVGIERLPAGVSEQDLDGWGWASAIRRIIVDRLQEATAKRLGNAEFRQIIHTHYQDSSKMLTWAAVLVDDSVRDKVEMMPLNRLEQYRGDQDAIDVSVPSLSPREILRLEEMMSTGDTPKVPGVETDSCSDYVRLHRWYPPVSSPI